MTGKPRKFIGRRDQDKSLYSGDRGINTQKVHDITPGNQLSHYTTNSFMKTIGGFYTGPIGYQIDDLTISSGILDLTTNTAGDNILIRKNVNVNPESGTTDTIDLISCEGKEIPQQELRMISLTGDTLTITHNSGSASGNNRAILCPDDMDFTLDGQEAIELFYNDALGVWVIITGAGGGGGGSASFPLNYPVDRQGNKSGTVTHDLDSTTGHKLEFTATAACDITISNIPTSASNAMDFLIEVTQDSTGNWPITFNDTEWDPVPSFGIGPDTVSLISVHADGDGKLRPVLLLNATTTVSGEVFTWTADHSANGNDFILDAGASTKIRDNAGTMELEVSSAVHASLDATNFNVDTNINMTNTGAELDLNSNTLRLDLDGDTLIDLATDDEVKWQIGNVASSLVFKTNGQIDWSASGYDHSIIPSATEFKFDLGGLTDSLIITYAADSSKQWIFTDNHLDVRSDSNGFFFESIYNPTTPVDDDVPGLYQWNQKNSIGTIEPHAEMKITTTDVTNGTEDSDIDFSVMNGGTITNILRLDGSVAKIQTLGFGVDLNGGDIDDVGQVNRQSPTDISGARNNPEQALKDLLTDLASIGLITDSTTAS